MSPTMATELLVRFNAPLSAWWLVLILPAAAILTWLLYRVDHPGLSRGSKFGLSMTRVCIMLTLLTLAFRPDLVWRRTLRYPGRVVVLVDDSASMSARDDRMTADEALRLARAIDPALGRDAPAHQAALTVREIARLLSEFERDTRGLDRAADAYWDRAGRTQKAVDERFTKAGEVVAALRAGDIDEKLKDAHGKLDTLLGGRAAAGRAGFDDAFRRLDELAESLSARQGADDTARIAAGDKSLEELVASVRAKDRLSLAKSVLAGVSSDVWPAGQSVEWVSLLKGDRAARVDAIEPAHGRTDIITRIETEIGEKSDFPLSGVVLVSDGRDTVGRDTAGIERLLAKAQSPVVTALAGGATPPSDVALVGVVAPPFAVAGREVALVARVRSSVETAQPLRIEASIAGRVVATADAVINNAVTGTTRDIALRFTPDTEGVARVTLRVASAPGEVVPAENNTRDVVIHVRKSPVRVLVLDGTPRWETRFAVNILQRLPYVDLNTIFLSTRAEALLTRGNKPGAWPGDDEAINTYDLIVVGGVPPDTLTTQDGDRLRGWIDRGGTLLLLAPEPAALPDAVRKLCPATSTATQPAAHPARLDQLALDPTGVHHPLTAALADRLPVATDSQLGSEFQALLVAENRDVLAWRPVGEGKMVCLLTDRLWEPLNPTLHRAHQQLFVELVTWSIEGGWSEAKEGKSGDRLFVDRRRGTGDVQIWWQSADEKSKVDALKDEKVVASATPVAPPRKGGMSSAVLASLPAGRVMVRRAGESSGVAVEIVGESHELDDLSRDDSLAIRMANASGGGVGGLADIDRLLRRIEPRERVEREERVWRLWDSSAVFVVLFGLLVVEWVWRKLVGRV